LNITQQGSPSQADCVCYTDVSYTINGILHTEVNVIFINGVQVYCYNDTIIQDACNICGTWEWKNVYDTNSIVTLTIYPITNLVTVSKSPVEMGYYDGFHQFGNGNQYLLQNDTLHRMNPPYGSVFCDHFYDFEITKISENEMELEYLGLVFTDLFHLKHYLFNKIIIE